MCMEWSTAVMTTVVLTEVLASSLFLQCVL
jgi:hypothetical protein